MFYYVSATYSESKEYGDGFVHNGVGVVWAEDSAIAFYKASVLYGAYSIISLTVHPLELDKIKDVAVKGGMHLTDFRAEE